ncbi:MAG: flagellar basal-body rod protein FlgG [Nevskiaceae bacterium]|nr:MAG: flagellar basal-body rod protein FlgG [Nevskiaceae bacterium]TBR75150.1 MAG: flagellar basal-body rod protein FlgG [Nevskiaceae bacterium]
MISSFYIGATGLGAQQARIDAISNNISNVNTTAYKQQRVSFEDLFYRPLLAPTGLVSPLAGGLIGQGTAIARTDTIFTPGDLQKTGNTLDVAIKGDGFFEVQLADGTRAYTRLGSLSLDSNGQLATQSGDLLTTQMTVPPDASNIQISENGQVTATLASQSQPATLGQLQLSNFINPDGLQPLGSGLYAATESSGQPYSALPGQQGTGLLEQGYLEASNVDLASEMVNLVVAQQAYQISSKVVQISDQILSTIANLPSGA